MVTGMEFNIWNLRLGQVDVEVSDEDADLANYSWSLSGGKGSIGKYVSRRDYLSNDDYRNGKVSTVYLHRIVAFRMGIIAKVSGEGRSGLSIDHVDGNKFNNRRDNLRAITRKQQMNNLNDALRSTNTSGYRGVSYSKLRGDWYASVMVSGKTINLGNYPTWEEAVDARKAYDEHGIIPEFGNKVRTGTSSGVTGVSFDKRSGKWVAYATLNRKRVQLGLHATKEEAVAARKRWDAEHK